MSIDHEESLGIAGESGSVKSVHDFTRCNDSF